MCKKWGGCKEKINKIRKIEWKIVNVVEVYKKGNIVNFISKISIKHKRTLSNRLKLKI